MKKLALTIAIVLGLGMTSFAEYGGGLFQRGMVPDEEFYGAYYGNRSGGSPMLPNHGETENQDAPIGNGIAVLLGLGAAYASLKKRKSDE